LSHLAIWPSSIVGESLGMITLLAISKIRQDYRIRIIA
jgi:hypothetical protein